jgi:general secretion pathway protein D
MDQEKNESNSMKWLSIAAGTTFLIGLVGLLAIMTKDAWAADPAPTAPAPKTGFAAGTKAFTNPFGNTSTPPAADMSDDEDDDLDFGDQPPAAAANTGKNGAAPAATVSMGGSPNSGVISGNSTPNVRVDSETGEGSKEMVTDFNYPDADIMDIAKTLGRLTGKNFIFDKDVKGRISIISNSPITVGDAWRAFLTSLDMAGFALIPSGSYLRIARNRDARDKQLRTYTGEYSPDTDALVTRIFALKYINADEVARTFRSFMPANSRIMSYDQTNSVIVTDTGANIAKLGKMLDILDIEGYDAGIEVIQVRWASATELAKLIDQLLPGTGAPATPGGAPRFGNTSGGRFSARRTKEGGIINTIIADDRTNNLIVHANTRGADQVRELVAKLDQKIPAPSGGGKVHVVYLQFADSEAVAATLNNFSSQGAGGFKPTGAGAGGTGVNPVAQNLFEGGIKVSSDKATNSLVVTASPADFVTVQRVINRLDIPRDEVYVECVIMEVSLSNSNNFAANLISPASGILSVPSQDIFNIIQNPASASGAVIGFKSGGSQNIAVGTSGQTVNVSSVQGLITAIATNTKSNVLATPQIIALDNTEASFESSENIPILTSTAVPNAGVAQSVTKERIVLSMKIKPQINKLSNFVKLDIETKDGEIEHITLPSAVQNLAFATLDRTAKTTVIVADGDTVVIGGLIRDNVNDQVTKIPILGDIPLLGWLFKATNTTISKSNLLVFLTPHIVRQYEKVRAILDKKLKERDDYIERNAGGDDGLRYQRDDIIRSLPDLKKTLANKPQTTVTIDDDQPAAVEVNPGNPFTGGDGHENANTPGPIVPAVPLNPPAPPANP